MKNYNIARHLGAVSALALTTAATIASVQPASAETILGGGASLVSLVIRDLANCYNGTQPTGAAQTNPACTAFNSNSVLYASTGSGAGVRTFLTNDSQQLIPGPLPSSAKPSNLPVYLGYGVTKYPYERAGNLSFDFGSSEAPLSDTNPPPVTPWTGFTPATGWETLANAPAIVITGLVNGAATTYNQAKLGKIVQVPFAEVGVALGVNAPLGAAATVGTKWQVKWKGPATAPIVMSLSQAQVCAIYSATVTDWNDQTTDIAYRDRFNVLGTYKFMAPNGGLPYTTSSLPIRLVYRNDSSGTTFIMLNWLNAVCPFFDDGVNKYTQIFGTPSTSFSTLITRINTAFPARAADTATWIAQTGNGAVASSTSNFAQTPAAEGRIGYLSADFVTPYSTTVTAPTPAAVQDEAQRLRGWEVPSSTTQYAKITPANVNKAWLGFPLPPTTTGDYRNFNPYNVTQVVYGGLLGPRSRLATPTAYGAYPINGTGFLFLYGCYKDATGARVSAITDFMSWVYGGQGSPVTFPAGTPATSTRDAPKNDPNVKAILNAAGFNPLPPLYARRIIDRYVRTVTTAATPKPVLESITATASGNVRGCAGVVGGAD